MADSHLSGSRINEIYSKKSHLNYHHKFSWIPINSRAPTHCQSRQRESRELIYSYDPAPDLVRLWDVGSSMGSGPVQNGYPLVNKHNYGISPFLSPFGFPLHFEVFGSRMKLKKIAILYSNIGLIPSTCRQISSKNHHVECIAFCREVILEQFSQSYKISISFL